MSRLFRATLVLFASASATEAQRGPRPAIADSSSRRIMARVGNETQAVWFKNILRQSEGKQPQTKLDELADSLSRRAVDPASARRDSEAYNRAVSAVLALLEAGAVRGQSGTPYTGSFDRL